MAATGQYLTELAVELSNRGHSVTVIAGDRGYDDPSVRFPRREQWKGITIIRIPSLSWGKQSRWRRAVNFGSFMINCTLRLLLLPRFDRVVALTSPPLISLLGALFVRVKGGRLFFWVMDLNPDEAIAAGWLKERSFTTRILRGLIRSSMRQAHCVIALDRFMKERILANGVSEDRITVLPPWSHDNDICFDERGRQDFRVRHNLARSFVVMYSGNHSPCHPLDTLLEATLRLADKKEIAFCFVGGGSEQKKVRAFAARHNLENIKCFSYQPLDELSASLSAADLHTVVMGDAFLGIVHPSKIYNILAIGSPFLYIGPKESHVTEIASQSSNGLAFYSARHGEVDRVVAHIIEAVNKRFAGNGGSRELAGKFAKAKLLLRLVELLEEPTQPQNRLP